MEQLTKIQHMIEFLLEVVVSILSKAWNPYLTDNRNQQFHSTHTSPFFFSAFFLGIRTNKTIRSFFLGGAPNQKVKASSIRGQLDFKPPRLGKRAEKGGMKVTANSVDFQTKDMEGTIRFEWDFLWKWTIFFVLVWVQVGEFWKKQQPVRKVDALMNVNNGDKKKARLPHWKLTYPLKSMVGRWNFLLKWSLFRGHVNFRGGKRFVSIVFLWCL